MLMSEWVMELDLNIVSPREWQFIQELVTLDLATVDRHYNMIDWNILGRKTVIDNDVMKKYRLEINPCNVNLGSTAPIEHLRIFQELAEWDYIWAFRPLTYDFIIEFSDYIILEDVRINETPLSTYTDPELADLTLRGFI